MKFLKLLSQEILRILAEHDRYDPTVHHQAMALTTGKSEANGFARQLRVPPPSFLTISGSRRR